MVRVLRSPVPGRRDAPAAATTLTFAGHLPVVAVTGDLDLMTADAVTSAVRAACALADRVLAIDLSEVAFLDVVGVHALERAHAHCFAEGVSVVLAGASPAVARLLRLVRGPHSPVLPMYPSVAAVAAGLATPRPLLTG